MKKRIILLLSILMFSASPAFARSPFSGKPIKKAGNFGVGVGAGTLATGLSMKYFLSDSTSVQGNVGFWRGCFGCGRFRGNFYSDALALSVDFLLERGPLGGDSQFSVDWEIGAGGGLGFNDNANLGLGVSGVLGLQLNIHAIPIDLVIEFRPGIIIVPDVYLNLVDFTGHVRYYF